MNELHIDIETFCELNLKKVGVYKYAEDLSFEIMLVCWTMNGVSGEWRSWVDPIPPDSFLQAVEDADIFVAFNAPFERICFSSRHAQFQLGLPAKLTKIENWRCAMAQALAAGLPGNLEGAIGALMPGRKKYMPGYRAMLKLSKPRKPSKKNPETRWTHITAPNDYASLVQYCHQDVFDEATIWHRTQPLIAAEWDLYAVDQRINDRGVSIDLEAVTAAQKAGVAQKEILNEEAQNEYGFNLSQTTVLAEYLGVDSVAKSALEKLLEMDIDPVKRRVVELRLEFAKTSVSKLDAMLRSRTADGRLHGMFQFNGAAATNRWAGRIVQLQNLIRAGVKNPEKAISDVLDRDIDLLILFYGPVLTLISKLIRQMLVPEPGKIFAVCDYSAIEAVVLGWLADCDFYMNEFRGDGKLYEAMASRVYGIPKEQIKNPSDERHLGKTAILGLGFQMGEDKFISTARDQGSEEPENILRLAHHKYRANTPEISDYEHGFWAVINRAALAAVNNPGQQFNIAHGRIRFRVVGKWLYMRLPSGRPLAYYDPRVVFDSKFQREGLTYMGMDSYTHKWTRIRTYGGKLTENAVQAIARDLLGHAMKKVDAAGHDIVMHVHDELVTEGEYTDARWLETLMCDKPDWAAGMPVRAESKLITRYSK